MFGIILWIVKIQRKGASWIFVSPLSSDFFALSTDTTRRGDACFGRLKHSIQHRKNFEELEQFSGDENIPLNRCQDDDSEIGQLDETTIVRTDLTTLKSGSLAFTVGTHS